MTDEQPSGTAHVHGDHVDTDVIIPARHCTTMNEAELASHCLEDLDPSFVDESEAGDFIVAGINFGCGSSREQAPLAIKGAGVAGVIARSFARIFFRNAVNVGLPVYECPEAVDAIQEGDRLQVDPEAGRIVNETRGEQYEVASYPPAVLEIIEAGGMVPYVRQKLQ